MRYKLLLYNLHIQLSAIIHEFYLLWLGLIDVSEMFDRDRLVQFVFGPQRGPQVVAHVGHGRGVQRVAGLLPPRPPPHPHRGAALFHAAIFRYPDCFR